MYKLLDGVAPIALVLLTYLYVVATRRLIHSSHRAMMRPLSLYAKGAAWAVRLQNYGPGIALNVHLRGLVDARVAPAHDCALRTRMGLALGPYAVPSGKCEEFIFARPLVFRAGAIPLVVKWSTSTGQAECSAWIVRSNDRVTPLGRIGQFVALSQAWLESWSGAWYSWVLGRVAGRWHEAAFTAPKDLSLARLILSGWAGWEDDLQRNRRYFFHHGQPALSFCLRLENGEELTGFPQQEKPRPSGQRAAAWAPIGMEGYLEVHGKDTSGAPTRFEGATGPIAAGTDRRTAPLVSLDGGTAEDR